tara:strand:- start:23494 stop:24249 length:756 start_codon:yes stop_codon:yes gene_type:complete
MSKTLCKNCIFAIKKDKEQTGCELERLELYKELGCVFDAEDMQTGEKSFVIEGRYCLACRNHDWGKNVDEDKWKKTVWEEMQLQFQAMVFYDKNRDELIKTVSSLANQSLKPKKITVIRKPKCKEPAEKIVEYMDSLGIEWKIQNILQKSTDEKCVDIVQTILPKQYYAVFYSGVVVPEDFFESISYSVNELMLQFTMLSPNSSGDGKVVPTVIHNYYGGNNQQKLEKKIEEDGCLENIIPVTKICPSFPK